MMMIGRLLKKMNKYIIGEKYFASNYLAGKNMQSSGELVGWTEHNLAILYNKNWGIFYATVKNLDEHNTFENNE